MDSERATAGPGPIRGDAPEANDIREALLRPGTGDGMPAGGGDSHGGDPGGHTVEPREDRQEPRQGHESAATAPARGSGLSPHRAGALSYLAGPFTGALFLVLDEDVPYVRFHALQSIVLTMAWVALWMVVLLVALVLGMVPIVGPTLAVFVRFVVAAVSFGVWLYAMARAYRGEEWEIPGIGPVVRRLEEGPAEPGAA